MCVTSINPEHAHTWTSKYRNIEISKYRNIKISNTNYPRTSSTANRKLLQDIDPLWGAAHCPDPRELDIPAISGKIQDQRPKCWSQCTAVPQTSRSQLFDSLGGEESAASLPACIVHGHYSNSLSIVGSAALVLQRPGPVQSLVSSWHDQNVLHGSLCTTVWRSQIRSSSSATEVDCKLLRLFIVRCSDSPPCSRRSRVLLALPPPFERKAARPRLGRAWLLEGS